MLGLFGLLEARADDGMPYVKKDTWRETIDESLREMRRVNVKPTFKNTKNGYTSKVVKGGDKAVSIRVDTTGWKDLILFVDGGGDGIGFDHSVWCDATLIGEDGKEVWLSSLKPIWRKVGHGRLLVSADDKKNFAVVGQKKYGRYMWAHAESVVHYRLEGKYTRFEAKVGIDRRDETTLGSARFTVTSDKRRVSPSLWLRPKRNTYISSFWLNLYTDFSADRVKIMRMRDWLRQDKLKLASPPAAFRTSAMDQVAAVRKVFDYVKTAGADLKALKAELTMVRRIVDKNDAKTDWRALYLRARGLRRKAIFSHPALDFDNILVNVNPPTMFSHNGDQFLGRHSRAGKGLTILSDWKADGMKATRVLDKKLPEGAVRDPDLHCDGTRVVFAFCDHTETNPTRRRYFLYEAAIDGSWVKQLTGTKNDPFKTWHGRATAMIEDNDPCYLPDGRIVFLSTRSQSFGRCHGGRYNPAWVLHNLDPKTTAITQLSFGNENEVEPSILNDGRILFTRWEYTNRHEMLFHKLWWCRPDGTSVAHFFGNDMTVPHQFVEATAIPDSHKVVAIGQGHHSYNTGTIVVIDTRVAENGEKAITRITPETSYSESQGWPSIHYSHPYPITEELFLASRANHRVHRQRTLPPIANRGIYLVYPDGGRELIFEDPTMATVSPIALRSRERPPALPSVLPPTAKDTKHGTVFVQNAYLTRNDPEGLIKPGMIKALRINALGVQPRARRSACSATVPVEIPKKVLGTVPVDENGAAYFKAPAGVSLQVQTLDKNGMAIMTERSFFYLQPGENRSCIGCHEETGTAPVMTAIAKVSKMQPVKLTPPAGPQYKGGLSFMRTVQPVLDRYCIGCHGLGKDEKANKVGLIDDGKTYPRPYRELIRRGQHRVGSKRYMGGLAKNISRPRDYFAYQNKVAHMLLKNHGEVKMDKDSYMRIIEWLDLNAQCYGDLFPNKLEDRKIQSEKSEQMQALRAYIKATCGDAISKQPIHALINRAQLEESRILMAPLSKTGGGWGQMKPNWKDRKDPGYLKMARLVDACIIKSKNDNVNGWEPTLEQGGGEEWVIKARKDHLEKRAK